MITLKELIENQEFAGVSDIQVIKSFFTLNDLEEYAIDLISELTKSKVSKIKNRYVMAESWICMLPSKYLYENYDLDIADHLHNLELNFLMNNGELSGGFLDWAKENIPNIKMPQVYFTPLIKWLEEKNVKFKGRK